MTVPTLLVSSDSAITIPADVLVLAVAKTADGPRLLGAPPELSSLQDSLAAIGVTGAVDELRRLPGVGSAGSIAIIGIGAEPTTPDNLRYAAGSATRQLRGIDSVVLDLPTASPDDVLAVLEGAAIGAYSYTVYRSGQDATRLPARSITVVTGTAGTAATAGLVEHAMVVADALSSVRDLVNAPPSDLYPESFAAAVHRLATDLPVDVDVLGEPELEAGGFGGILGIGQGSTRGPRLVKISYSPAGAARHLALVGKGITFDTGGLSLKPAAGMVGMKYDMAGAATVMAVVLAAAKLRLDVRLTAWLCIAENMPSGSATRPNDVLRIRGGKTVEVLNTDAEGRVVMADGLVAASEEFPDAIIDVATLTGAARVALGNRYAGVMGDTDFVATVVGAAQASGELFWPMPLPAELRSLLNSDVADIANAKVGNTAAGMLLAGVFLREFVGKTEDDERQIPWAHLDIAGPANNTDSGFGFTGKGPTGVAVRALLRLAEDISRP
ncbi:MAG: aminopeptidase [Microbacteriaceae bacterium]|nr:aminopeptidase [Microbacteriaceae bacterium]